MTLPLAGAVRPPEIGPLIGRGGSICGLEMSGTGEGQ